MNTQLTTLYGFALASLETLLSDIDGDEMQRQPESGGNTPAWIVGHLAIVNDMAATILGQERALPPEWHAEFGAGSTPAPQQHAYPSKEELLAGLRESHARFKTLAKDVDFATLTEPNPVAALVGTLPTVGDLLAHIASTHLGMHIGQLQTWRRQTDRPPLF